MKILLAIFLLTLSGCAHAPTVEWCGYEPPVYGDDC